MQCYHLVQSLLCNFSSFLGNKEKSMKFYLMNNFFSQEFIKMFGVGAKIRVGRETGNTGIFCFGLTIVFTTNMYSVFIHLYNQLKDIIHHF